MLNICCCFVVHAATSWQGKQLLGIALVVAVVCQCVPSRTIHAIPVYFQRYKSAVI